MEDTQTRQREFRRELGLRNLVTSQILSIVGLFWIGQRPGWALRTSFFGFSESPFSTCLPRLWLYISAACIRSKEGSTNGPAWASTSLPASSSV